MIRRKRRTPAGLSKSVVKVDLLGGSEDMGEMSFGFELSGGKLIACPSPKLNSLSSYSTDGLFAAISHPCLGATLLYFENGSVVVFNKSGTFNTFEDFSEGKPFSVEARNENGDLLFAVVCGKTMVVHNRTTRARNEYSLSTGLYGGIVHCGRLFAADLSNGYKVVWSGLRITDWEDGIDGSGYIILDSDLGKVLTLENFGNDVLCVRERGFTVIKAMADSRNFRISTAQCSVKTAETVNVGAAFGQRYYFTTAKGLYCFDGTSLKLEYADKNVAGYAGAYAYGDGYVYVECQAFDMPCIMRFDTFSGKVVFLGIGCSKPFVVDGVLYCSYGNYFYEMATDNDLNNRTWRSKPIGGCGRKTLKSLYVTATDAPSIRISCDKLTRSVQATGLIPVNFSGETITVNVMNKSDVDGLVAELEVRK